MGRAVFAYSYEQWHSARFRDIQAREWRLANQSRPGMLPVRPLDERILKSGPLRVYRELDPLSEEAAVLRTLCYRMHVIDASKFTTTGAFHATVRLMLEDRSVYEETLEGFAQALRVLPFSQFGRAAIVFQHFDVFARHCATLASEVLDCIGRFASLELAQGRRVIVLLQSDSPTFELGMLEGRADAASQSEFPAASSPPSSGVQARSFKPAVEFEDFEDTLVERRVAR